MGFEYEKYIRGGKLPHIWCPGCGLGTVMKSILRAIDKLGLDKNKVAMVSGIGCTSRMPGYLDFNTLHTTHGRALTFATGLKLARPELTVLVVAGDGDMLAIGGNHFIHACRRNIDITAIVVNNFIYGMTGGQHSPTSPSDSIATTSPYGNVDPQFDVVKVAEGAGATFVARTTSYHTAQAEQLVAKAIQHKGFSVIDLITGCPTYYGRKNKQKSATDMLLWQKDSALPIQAAQKLPPEKLAGKILTGIFIEKQMPEYVERYKALQARLAGKGN